MVSVYREHKCNIFFSHFFIKIDNESPMAMAMVWRRINDRPLPKARLSHFTDARMCHYAPKMFIIYIYIVVYIHSPHKMVIYNSIVHIV